MLQTSLAFIDQGLNTWDQLLVLIKNHTLNSILSLNLHSNLFNVFDKTVASLSNLTSLDLSSNNVQSLTGISMLKNLKYLNLSNNKIVELDGIQSLSNLNHLILSFNHIQSLVVFSYFNAKETHLQFLDIKGNEIRSVDQIDHLKNIPTLKDLIVSSDENSVRFNPFCKIAFKNRIFDTLSNLKTLDGVDRFGNVQSNLDEYSDTYYDHFLEGISLDSMQAAGNIVSGYNDQYTHNSISSNPLSSIPKPERNIPIDNNVNKKLLERLNEVEETLETLESQKQTTARDDRMHHLENQVEKLITVLLDTTTQSTKNANISMNTKDNGSKVDVQGASQPLPSDGGKGIDTDRLLNLEAQMKELIQLTVEKSNQPIIYKKIEKNDQYLKQKEAFKNLEKEVFGPNISSSDDPDNKPSHSTRGRSVSWNDGESDTEIPTREYLTQNSAGRPTTPTKRTIRIGKPLSKNGVKSSKSISDSKVFQTLEAEERRLRENELLYAEKIKSLTLEVASLKETAHQVPELKNSLLDINSKHTILQKEFEKSQSELQKVTQQFNLSQSKSNELSLANNKLKVLLDKMQNANLELTQAKEWNQRENVKLNDSFNDLEQSYKKREREMELLMIKLNELDSEKNKSNLRILKEREQFKIKLAEMKKEKQLVLDNLEQSYREVKFLKTTLNTKEEAFRDKIEHLISTHHENSKESILKSTSQLEQVYQMKLEKIEFSLNQSRLAYESLEKEYLTTVQRDAKKIESLQLNLDESKKMVLTLKVNLDNLTNRDKEKTSTISDLVKMVKDLKSQSDSAIQFHKNNIVQLQNELLGCKQQIQDQCKSGMDLDALIGKLEKVKGELSEAVQRERNLVTEKERLNKKIEELENDHKKRRVELESNINGIRNEMQDLKTQLENKDDIIRVKESMLEDQNQSIKTLKTNLENKIRDFQNLMKDYDNLKDDMLQQEEGYQTELDKLQLLVEREQQAHNRYREIAQEYRDERDAVRTDLAQLQTKLDERNASIEKIESEVTKVQEHFRKKQMQMDSNHKRDIENLKLKYETENLNVELYLKEKASLIQSLKDSQTELIKVTKQRDTIQSELQFVLEEMRKQKQLANEKLARLKAALD